jgi:hypothetical protein
VADIIYLAAILLFENCTGRATIGCGREIKAIENPESISLSQIIGRTSTRLSVTRHLKVDYNHTFLPNAQLIFSSAEGSRMADFPLGVEHLQFVTIRWASSLSHKNL